LSLPAFILRRLALLAVTLFFVSLIIFAITQILPGDVATMIMGQSATPEDLATIRRQLGLDRPATVQYLDWLGRAMRGDLGISTRFNQPVASLLWERIVNTGKLAGVGLAIAAPAGMLLGIFTGIRAGRPIDHVLSTATLFGTAMPEFVTGAVFIIVFATWLGWFPPFSAITAGMGVGEQLWLLVLPALSLSLVILAYILRMMRASVIDVLASPYVRAAVLNGLPRYRVILRHALPTALGPTLTVLALSIGWMVGGLVIVENMFGYPGIGRLLVFAIQNRDVPLIQATSLLGATVYALANLLADIAGRMLDPRARND
jgi:peptide/nickel transport system permease protein